MKLKLTPVQERLLNQVKEQKKIVCLHVLDQELTNAFVTIILELLFELEQKEDKLKENNNQVA